MATGVNIFFKIASILALYLEDWDIEIIHNNMRLCQGCSKPINNIFFIKNPKEVGTFIETIMV